METLQLPAPRSFLRRLLFRTACQPFPQLNWIIFSSQPPMQSVAAYITKPRLSFINTLHRPNRKKSFPTIPPLKNAVFWDVALCRSLLNRRFGGTYRLHLQGRKIRERGTTASRWLQTDSLYIDICSLFTSQTSTRYFNSSHAPAVVTHRRWLRPVKFTVEGTVASEVGIAWSEVRGPRGPKNGYCLSHPFALETPFLFLTDRSATSG
jgi:hypothetical protein